MADFKIKVAGFVFGVHSIHDSVLRDCRDYITDDEPEAEFTITTADIEFERKESILTAKAENHKDPQFSDAQLESSSLHRKIAENIPEYGAWVFHGALIEYKGAGYLFTAKSGTGKTTHILNWCRHFEGVNIVNGDKPILKLSEGGLYGYGTPWCGKERWQNNTSVKIKAIVKLTRSEENYIKNLNFADIFPVLMSQSYSLANDTEGLMFKNICAAEEACGYFKLGCNMDEESAEIAYRGMNSYGVEQKKN